MESVEIMTVIEEYVCDAFTKINRKLSEYFFNLCVRILRFRDTPLHVAYIADGNRTYSKQHGISRYEAYIKGMEKILRQINLSSILRISDLTFFIYSCHNSRRNNSERNDVLEVVELLLKLLSSDGADYRYNIIGDVSTLPPNIGSLCNRLLLRSNTNAHARTAINLAINYSAKTEMIRASQRLLNGHFVEPQITESTLDAVMYTSCVRKPDLIIRTSGQRRLSDFYLWQSSRSVMFFADQCWPEFSDWNLLKAIFCHQFFETSKRERELGHSRCNILNENTKTCSN